MYISAIMRTMFEKNIVWGKSYNLFRSSKNVLDQYKSFLNVFIKIIQKNDIYISDDFENKSNIKGSHLCSILFEYVKKKRIIHHTIEYLENFIIEAEEGLKSPKITIFLAQLYCEDEKYNKSLSIVAEMLKKYVNDPFLLYYQAKYMLKLMAIRQALTIVNSIVQYNHY